MFLFVGLLLLRLARLKNNNPAGVSRDAPATERDSMEIVIDIGNNITGVIIGGFAFLLFLVLLKAGDGKDKQK